MKSKLPSTMSALLRVANNDMRSLDRNRYLPHSGDWHHPYFKGESRFCTVCYAGAVMAGTLNADWTQRFTPGEMTKAGIISRNDSRKLLSIDSLRVGNVGFAAGKFFYVEPFNWEKNKKLTREIIAKLMSSEDGAFEVRDGSKTDLQLYTWSRPLACGYFKTWNDADKFLASMDVLADDLENVGL